jgi:hypothetical protein
MPPVSDNEEAFCFPYFTPEKPSGYYLAKGVEKFSSWLPAEGFKYNSMPSIPYEELAKK